MANKRKRITLATDDGGILELSTGRGGRDVWLRVESASLLAPIDSVNYRGQRRTALHDFAKRIVAATAPGRADAKEGT
jgi:uncharacterized protein YcaQ